MATTTTATKNTATKTATTRKQSYLTQANIDLLANACKGYGKKAVYPDKKVIDGDTRHLLVAEIDFSAGADRHARLEVLLAPRSVYLHINSGRYDAVKDMEVIGIAKHTFKDKWCLKHRIQYDSVTTAVKAIKDTQKAFTAYQDTPKATKKATKKAADTAAAV